MDQSSQVQSAALEQYIQGISKGKFELEEWRSITTAMPGQIDQVAKSLLGASGDANALYEALKDGTISIDDFTNAFVNLDKQGLEGMGFSLLSKLKRALTVSKPRWTTRLRSCHQRGKDY